MAQVIQTIYFCANYSMSKKYRKKSELLVAFGDVIRNLRKGKGFSQEELADRAGLHRTYIGMIERGEKNIALENINKLSKALNTPMHEILKKLK